jgi:hypothetical protein
MKRIVYYIFSDISLKCEKVSFDTSHPNLFNVCMLYCSCLVELVREIIQFDAQTLASPFAELQPSTSEHTQNNFLCRNYSRKTTQQKNMDEALDWVSDNQGIAALTWVAVVFATAVLWFTTKGDSEAAVEFEVPLPRQLESGWQGEVLREPSLKVCFSSFSFYLIVSRVFAFFLFSLLPEWGKIHRVFYGRRGLRSLRKIHDANQLLSCFGDISLMPRRQNMVIIS